MQLVFIHGSGGSELVWKYQTEHFPDAVAVTLPGRPDGEPLKTVPQASQWLKQQADANGWQDLVLIGHSYGGGIALQYALDYPDDVSAIIMIGSGGRLRVHPGSGVLVACGGSIHGKSCPFLCAHRQLSGLDWHSCRDC